MALSRAIIIVALVATILSNMAVAKDFVVGDESAGQLGLITKLGLQARSFVLGTHSYTGGKDNVIRVNGSDFMSCSVPSRAAMLTSGHDTILTTTGRRWYIFGVGNHCRTGQKLFITVLPPQGAWSPEPSFSLSPSPSPSPMPAPEVPPSNAPWTASVPHFGRYMPLPKKLTKFF